MSDQANDTQVKLNVFALPNQTTILAGLIVVVLLGSLGIGSLGLSPILIWPLALSLVVLSLRAFLARPEQDCAQYRLARASAEFQELQQAIEATAKQIGLRPVPRLMVSEKLKEIYTFGSFRHRYIALGRDYARTLAQELNDPDTAPTAQARLIHELYHFKTGDYWQLGYVEALLSSTFKLLGWAVLFFLGLVVLMVFAGHYALDPSKLVDRIGSALPQARELLIQLFPSTAEVEGIRQKAAGINLALVLSFVVFAFQPFVILSVVLRFFYRPKLWRMREFYADAGAVQTQGDILGLTSALSRIPLPLLRRAAETQNSIAPRRGRGRKSGVRLARLWQSLRGLRRFWPSFSERIEGVKYPYQIFDGWLDTAVLVGSLSLLLDMLLASPLTLLYLGGWPMHFSTLVILVTIALSLIPALVRGKPVRADVLKIIGMTLGLRLGWILLTIGLMLVLLITDPATLDSMLSAGVIATAHYAGTDPTIFTSASFPDLGTFVAEVAYANSAQVGIVLIILVTTLSVIVLLLRRLLTWYRLPQAQKWLMRTAVGLIIWMALVLALLVLPISTTLLLNPAELLNPVGLAVEALGGIVLLLGGWAFAWADRRYAGVCSHCNAALRGPYWLGRRCQSCDQRLHPWLIAEYET